MHHLDYFIGVDYGTDSVRSVIVDAHGIEIASSVFYYPRWKQRLYCDASSNWIILKDWSNQSAHVYHQLVRMSQKT